MTTSSNTEMSEPSASEWRECLKRRRELCDQWQSLYYDSNKLNDFFHIKLQEAYKELGQQRSCIASLNKQIHELLQVQGQKS
jgi:hypothetical protein